MPMAEPIAEAVTRVLVPIPFACPAHPTSDFGDPTVLCLLGWCTQYPTGPEDPYPRWHPHDLMASNGLCPHGVGQQSWEGDTPSLGEQSAGPWLGVDTEWGIAVGDGDQEGWVNTGGNWQGSRTGTGCTEGHGGVAAVLLGGIDGHQGHGRVMRGKERWALLGGVTTYWDAIAGGDSWYRRATTGYREGNRQERGAAAGGTGRAGGGRGSGPAREAVRRRGSQHRAPPYR